MSKIRIFVSILFLIFINATISQATPAKAIWKREIFISYNNTHYYSYLIERNQPGSYYHYTDSGFLCKYLIKNGETEKKILLRRIYHADTTAEGTWMHYEEVKEPLNIEKYLIKNKVFYAFPSDMSDGYKIIINKNGMFLEQNKKKALLMDLKNLEKYMKWVDKNAKVITYYESKTHFYFIVQYGLGCYDSNFYQSIVVINSSDVKNAEKSLQQRKEKSE